MSWRYIFFSFNGRLNRKPYWMASLLLAVMVAVGLAIVVSIIPPPGEEGSGGLFLPFLLAITAASLFCSMAISVKRLHDRNKSGLWMIIYFGVIAAHIGAEMAGLTGIEDNPTVTDIILAVAIIAATLWYLIEVGMLKGTEGPNRYGPDPVTHYRADASL